MIDATCKTCPFWWHRAEDGRLMETACRRNPPRAITMNVSGQPGSAVEPYWTVWPAAQPDDFCGEHPLRQRDRLAAMAMQGTIVNGVECRFDPQTEAPAIIARRAYSIADAMLAEAAKERP